MYIEFIVPVDFIAAFYKAIIPWLDCINITPIKNLHAQPQSKPKIPSAFEKEF